MNEPELRVATFNIRHASHDDGTVDHRALIASCRSLRADVLGLQEVDRRRRRSGWRDQSKVVARALRCRAVYGSVLRRGVIGHYGNALLARDIRDVRFVRLLRPSARQPRGAIFATARVAGTVCSVAVTHLQHHPAELRHLPAEAPVQLRALLEAFAPWPLPRIVLGDVNLGPANATPIFRAAGYEVAATPPSFPSRDPRITLDYVAVSGVELAATEVVETSVSDHRAVVATLRVS
jgi:endonuclease/exonuclease/phosphatase family metal-dependent hydrolase